MVGGGPCERFFCVELQRLFVTFLRQRCPPPPPRKLSGPYARARLFRFGRGITPVLAFFLSHRGRLSRIDCQPPNSIISFPPFPVKTSAQSCFSFQLLSAPSLPPSTTLLHLCLAKHYLFISLARSSRGIEESDRISRCCCCKPTDLPLHPARSPPPPAPRLQGAATSL